MKNTHERKPDRGDPFRLQTVATFFHAWYKPESLTTVVSHAPGTVRYQCQSRWSVYKTFCCCSKSGTVSQGQEYMVLAHA
ncbi:MAG: hypothetical protein GDA38_10225 [Hormoscilla sp. SP12CHS1]|nr:hypothetical protein [Hormoscilla sp. SP12CHS1]